MADFCILSVFAVFLYLVYFLEIYNNMNQTKNNATEIFIS